MKIQLFILLSPLAYAIVSQVGYFFAEKEHRSTAGFVWGLIGILFLWSFYFL